MQNNSTSMDNELDFGGHLGAAASSSTISLVHSVKLSRISCIIKVVSL
jgi:hypothetical protein